MLRRMWVRTLVLALVGLLVGAQGVSTAELVFRVERVTGDLWAKGWIETATGFKFPDGTTMATAGVGNGWSLTGNSGTNPATNFLGTTDDVAVEIRVNNARAYRIEPHEESPNIIGGWYGNTVGVDVYGATISGGGERGDINQVTQSFGTVGGGGGNTASDWYATVGGGQVNTASSWYATVGGGADNTASNLNATVGGGISNTASGNRATVSGGGENTANENRGTVGGGRGNTASANAATVGGGFMNIASGRNATVSGGRGNTASANAVTVGGGFENTASEDRATVGGGERNTASGSYATVGGGHQNVASGSYATVGGGGNNTASGYAATVGGGEGNTAAGDYSFVVGRRAKNTNPAHDGVFMFADSSTDADFYSVFANEFAVRASGGYRLFSNAGLSAGVIMAAGGSSWSSVSDRNVKANFAGVDTVQLLDALAGMPVSTWNFQAQSEDIRHIGPMAQDFNASFGYLFGEVESPLHINTMDAVGVSLAASQGLYTLVKEQAEQIAQQAEEIEDLRARLEALEKLVQGGE